MTPLETLIVVVLLCLLGGVGSAVTAIVYALVASGRAREGEPGLDLLALPLPPAVPHFDADVLAPLPPLAPQPSPSSADLLIYPASEGAAAAPPSERRPPVIQKRRSSPPRSERRFPSGERPTPTPLPMLRASIPPPAPVPMPWVRGHEAAGKFGSHSPLPLFRPPSEKEAADRTLLTALPEIRPSSAPPELGADLTRKMPSRSS